MKTLSLLILGMMAQIGFAASYSVPVPAKLLDFANYPDTKASGTMKEGVLSVEYFLPTALVGKKAPCLTFTGKAESAFIPVSGKHVHGVCMLSKLKPMTCVLRYPELQIDEPSRDEAIKEAFTGETLMMRTEVGRLFHNDPAGILSLDLTL